METTVIIIVAIAVVGDSGSSEWRMSRGSCPWEAPSIVFYVSRKVLGAPDSATLRNRVGPLKEPKTPETLEASEFEVWSSK